MKTITVSTTKGGEGKSSITSLLARFLGGLSQRVLVIDLDPQNSTSFHFVTKSEPKNIANALHHANIQDNIIKNVGINIDICQSDLALLTQRAMPTHLLRRLLATVSEQYDFCIIDTAPTWDNIVINGLRSADLIIYPVTTKSTFSIKTSSFFREIADAECPEILDRYAILLNRYKDGKETGQYVDEYMKHHTQFFESHLHETAQVKAAIDYGKTVTNSTSFDVLYPFLCSLSREIFEYFGLEAPERIRESNLVAPPMPVAENMMEKA